MNIALIGKGKMGNAIKKIALGLKHNISCIIDEGEPLSKLNECEVDIAIEFTRPDVAFENIQFCLKNNIPVISGTTGWLDRYHDIISICKENDGCFFYSSNFSLGVNLFFQLNEWMASRVEHSEFQLQIHEIHHTEKKDAPSGTAIELANGIIKNSQYTGWNNSENRLPNKINIISDRIENIPGTHSVLYISEDECIEIKHEAKNRDIFAKGVVAVTKWVYTKKGVFTMNDFLNSKN